MQKERNTETARLIQRSGLTQKAFAERFEIPLRTVEDWVAGRRCPPPYVLNMLQRLLFDHLPQHSDK